MGTQKHLGEESIGKLLVKYSIPAIIGMLVNALYNIVDRMFIGNIPDVGPLAITGVGITMPIMSILLAFGMLVGVGTTANISLKLGQGKRDEAERLIGNAFTLVIIISIAVTVLGLLFINPILNIFGASENTLFFAKQYMYVILGGSIFNLMSFALNSTIRADGNPKMAAITMIIGCVINIILDYVFIFIFNFGIIGAAMATVIAQAISTMLIIYYYTKGSSNLKLRREDLKLNPTLVKVIFSIGVAPFAMQIANSLVQIVANNSLKAYGGDLAIGAMATIASLNMVFMMPIFGINQGCQPIIGFNYGAKKYERAKQTTKYAMLAACTIGVIGFLLIQSFPSQAIGMFNGDPELTAIGVRGIRMYLLMMPLIGVVVVSTSYFQSTGKAKIAMFLSLLRQVILLIPFTLVLPLVFGLDGVWLAGTFSDFLAVIISVIFLTKEFKKIKALNSKNTLDNSINSIAQGN